MSFEKAKSHEVFRTEYKVGDIVRKVPRIRLFETLGAGSTLYEVTSVSRDPKGTTIVFGRPRGTNEKSEELSFFPLEKVTIQ